MKTQPCTLRIYVLAGAFVIAVSVAAAVLTAYHLTRGYSEHGFISLTLEDSAGIRRDILVLYSGKKDWLKEVTPEDSSHWVPISMEEFRKLNEVVVAPWLANQAQSYEPGTIAVQSQWESSLAVGLPRLISIPATGRKKLLSRLAEELSDGNAFAKDGLSRLAAEDISSR